MTEMGWYTFAPVPWVKSDSPPRFQGDGPACQAEWITVARPRRKLEKSEIGSRPGFYKTNINRDPIRIGSKPLDLMRALVRDYSRPGDLICDPFAGSGSTLMAAVTEGRNAVGAEVDPKTYHAAQKRIQGGYTPVFPALL